MGNKWGTGTGGDAELTATDAACSVDPPIYGRSEGGLTYMGWSCASLPFTVEFDNAGNPDEPDDQLSPTGCSTWGWDEITWFGIQSETFRNQWLEYAYFKIKCLDEVGHLEMPGRRGMTIIPGSWPGPLYRAAQGYGNQEGIIKALWDKSKYTVIDPSDLYKDINLNITQTSPFEIPMGPVIWNYNYFVASGLMTVKDITLTSGSGQKTFIAGEEIIFQSEFHSTDESEMHARTGEVKNYCIDPVIVKH